MADIVKTWHSFTKGTRFQILFYFVFSLVGIFLFLGVQILNIKEWQPVMIGFGIAFVSSSIIGFTQRLFFYDDFKSEMNDLVAGSLQKYLESYLFPFIGEGLECLFTDRRAALDEFIDCIKLENDKIIIIGSSLKGILDPTEEQKEKKVLSDLIRTKIEDKVTVRFLLTHPTLAFLREDAEGRAKGAIKQEILRTLRYLIGGNFVSENAPKIKVPIENIRLYKGTPSIFCIITSDKMLVNPYTYQANAYENFCFIVSRKKPNDLFSKILNAHYEKPWDNEVTTSKLTEEMMGKLESFTMQHIFPERESDLLVCESESVSPNQANLADAKSNAAD